MQEKIDFVMLWVDGNDPLWQKEKDKYSNVKGEKNKNRFRDWDNLQYWFRGVEKFAPWVNKIYFITWGHIPKWLNVNHPKLKIIKHEDYIPKEYLPTFNTNVIELNIFRIKELSEHFVLFNDDIFIIDKIKKEDFFNHGLPCDSYCEVNWEKSQTEEVHGSILQNNYDLINKRFNKKEIYRKRPFKYFNIKYGLKNNLRTIRMLKCNEIKGIFGNHLCEPFLKSDFINYYKLERDSFLKTFKNKFRTKEDISEYSIRYYNLLNGNFFPKKLKGECFSITDMKAIPYIEKQKGKVICLNDNVEDIEFSKYQKEINDALNRILNEKSKYEK